VFTVADGLLWLVQSLDRNSMVRKMQIMKMRGQAPIPGLHTFRITGDGVQVFPRVIVGPGERRSPAASPPNSHRPERLSIGVKVAGRDARRRHSGRHSVLLAGPSGSGKSVLATQFISEGARHDEPGIIAVFEKRPTEYSQDGTSGGAQFDRLVREGKVGIIHTRPLDLSIDEMLHEIVEAIHRLKARRLVIDSLSGFELALAPTFREDFRESLYRMVAVLTGMGITMMMTAELEDSYTDLRFSPHGTAFLTDAIIMQRYIELKGQLQRVMAVVKVRGSAHSKDLRAFEITDEGIVMGDTLGEYEGLLTGSPEPTSVWSSPRCRPKRWPRTPSEPTISRMSSSRRCRTNSGRPLNADPGMGTHAGFEQTWRPIARSTHRDCRAQRRRSRAHHRGSAGCVPNRGGHLSPGAATRRSRRRGARRHWSRPAAGGPRTCSLRFSTHAVEQRPSAETLAVSSR
jgi:KaiC/GvpD/RAD55 family RecA-like ATPase